MKVRWAQMRRNEAIPRRVREHLGVFAVFAAAILIWQGLSWASLLPRYLVPGPVDIVVAFLNPEIGWPRHILVTMQEIMMGFAVGVSVGLAIAVIVSQSVFLRNIILPYVVAVEAVPKIAVAPLIYILLGFNLLSRVTMVFLVSFFPIVLAATTGLVDVDQNLVYLLKSLDATEGQIFFKLRLPNSLPHLFDGLRLAAISAVIGAVIAEFVSSSSGLGFMIMNAENTFDPRLGFAAFALVSAISLGLYSAIELCARLSMPWFRKR
jgi:NitT/TauT family transport system permease protein